MKKLLIALLSAGLLLTGCSQGISSSVAYYQFKQPIVAMSRHSDDTLAQLRINTVELRGALNNRGIAMVLDDHQVRSANYHLWSEAPDTMLTAIAHQQLYVQMPQWLVVKGLPVITDADQQRYYELEYELYHFNGDQQGQAHIGGLWRLFYTSPELGRRLKAINYFNEQSPLVDDDFEGLVATLEQTWSKINTQVSNEIKLLALPE
ncbi:membrane integrity-associated transporter subunit PqiC [Pseudoalteromonas mariniglutinosa]|uniref:PqiC family protein n=1 Tax=Pseudoalteromonas mariniglutinosa TaxID=206042 RepID=UPI00384F6C6D